MTCTPAQSSVSCWTSPPAFLFVAVCQFLTVRELMLRVGRVCRCWHASRRAISSSRWTSPPAFLFLTVSQFLTVHELLARLERVSSRWHASRRFGWGAISFEDVHKFRQPPALRALLEAQPQSWRNCVQHVALLHAPFLSSLRNVSTLILDRGLLSAVSHLANLVHLEIFHPLSDLSPIMDPDLDDGNPASDPDLEHIARLTKLQTLSLYRSRFTCLQPLSSLTSLTELRFVDTHLTNAGLAPVAKLTQLTSIYFNGNGGISDDGLVHLAGLHNLTDLSLYDCNVRGPGLTHLYKLPLRTLRLCPLDAPLDAGALPLLLPLADSLQQLYMFVTAVGRAFIRENMPHVRLI